MSAAPGVQAPGEGADVDPVDPPAGISFLTARDRAWSPPAPLMPVSHCFRANLGGNSQIRAPSRKQIQETPHPAGWGKDFLGEKWGGKKNPFI